MCFWEATAVGAKRCIFSGDTVEVRMSMKGDKEHHRMGTAVGAQRCVFSGDTVELRMRLKGGKECYRMGTAVGAKHGICICIFSGDSVEVSMSRRKTRSTTVWAEGKFQVGSTHKHVHSYVEASVAWCAQVLLLVAQMHMHTLSG